MNIAELTPEQVLLFTAHLNTAEILIAQHLRTQGRADEQETRSTIIMALWEAASKYRPDKGAKFKTYFTRLSKWRMLSLWKHKSRIKRGGGIPNVSIDAPRWEDSASTLADTLCSGESVYNTLSDERMGFSPKRVICGKRKFSGYAPLRPRPARRSTYTIRDLTLSVPRAKRSLGGYRSKHGKYRKKCRDAGLCPKCGKPSAPLTFCLYHRTKLREQYQRRRDRKAIKAVSLSV
jgi:hypothetical protein